MFQSLLHMFVKSNKQKQKQKKMEMLHIYLLSFWDSCLVTAALKRNKIKAFNIHVPIQMFHLSSYASIKEVDLR